MQLRELVPPQSGVMTAADKDESKRPKHVVLSDTIALVKELQIKVLKVLLCMPVTAQHLSSPLDNVKHGLSWDESLPTS